MSKKIVFLMASLLFGFSAYAQDPASPQDNDRLIKQYMATKDTANITQMLTAYSEADETMLRDARHFAYLSSQFKNPSSPRHELQKTTATASVAKYECSSHSPRCNQFMTIASGMWALDSLSQQDPHLKDSVADFMKTHDRMKKIYDEEGAQFSNYMMLVMASIAQPGKLDDILTNYEQLGPLDMAAATNVLGMKPIATH